jgi:hypothetical protein
MRTLPRLVCDVGGAADALRAEGSGGIRNSGVSASDRQNVSPAQVRGLFRGAVRDARTDGQSLLDNLAGSPRGTAGRPRRDGVPPMELSRRRRSWSSSSKNIEIGHRTSTMSVYNGFAELDVVRSAGVANPRPPILAAVVAVTGSRTDLPK